MVKVTSQAVVEIRIDGRPRAEDSEKSDRDIVSDLCEWLVTQKDVHPVFSPHVGGGIYYAFWPPESAAKVLAWVGDWKQKHEHGG